MQAKKTLLTVMLASALALAGCTQPTDDGGGTGDEAGTATLNFDGTSGTETNTETVECGDGDASIAVVGNVDTGTLRVEVMDADNNVVWTESFTGDVDFEGDNLTGTPGTWTISAHHLATSGGGGTGNDTTGNDTTGNDTAGNDTTGNQTGGSGFSGTYTIDLVC